MPTHTIQLTGQLARAARALAGVSSTHISSAAGLLLRDFEKGRSSLDTGRLAALRLALEHHGAVFIADGDDGRGHGVKLKFPAEKIEKIETWEGEGGLAADDDVSI